MDLNGNSGTIYSVYLTVMCIYFKMTEANLFKNYKIVHDSVSFTDSELKFGVVMLRTIEHYVTFKV